jgi:integrase
VKNDTVNGGYRARFCVAHPYRQVRYESARFVHHSPALQVTATSAPFDYGRALSLREMARHYNEMPKYLLAPEVAGLLHYLPDWNQHAFINTLWNTGARLNETLALRRRDFHLND